MASFYCLFLLLAGTPGFGAVVDAAGPWCYNTLDIKEMQGKEQADESISFPQPVL